MIPVPEAQPFAVHPHVTLLAPFRSRALLDDPALHTELKDVLRLGRRRFDFALVEVRSSRSGIDYLAPEPAEPFRVTHARARAELPDFPPYGGLFDDVIPHLTLDEDAHPVAPPDPGPRVGRALVHSHDSTWDVVATFDLGG